MAAMRNLAPLAAALIVAACSPAKTDLSVTDATVVTSPNGAAGYFTVTGGRDADRLLNVEVPAMGPAMLHDSSMEGGVMRMRHLEAVDSPAGGTIRFERGAKHVMIEAGPAPLAAGTTTPVRLTFERRGAVTVDAKVESLTGGPH